MSCSAGSILIAVVTIVLIAAHVLKELHGRRTDGSQKKPTPLDRFTHGFPLWVLRQVTVYHVMSLTGHANK